MKGCDFCETDGVKPNEPRIIYDGKTVHGPWAWMCERHFKRHGISLGTGQGQKFKQVKGKTLIKLAG